jgi:uncharacterized membrane protein
VAEPSDQASTGAHPAPGIGTARPGLTAPASTGRRRPRALAPLAAFVLLLGLAPVVSAQIGLQVTTPFPAVAVAPGEDVTFDLQVSTNTSARIALEVLGAPEGWTATLQGGGFVVDGVATRGSSPAEVQLNVSVPEDAAEGSSRLTVRATSQGDTVDLDLDIRVAAAAAGEITIDTEIPVQEGPSSQTFSFPLTLRNDTAEDVTASVTATGPSGWTVESQIAGQEQAASAIVTAGDTLSVEISVTPAELAEAGDYPIDVVATAGGRTIDSQLGVRVTGSYELSVTTPDDRLSTSGQAGSTILMPILIENGGTAEVTNVVLEGDGPTDWTVDFGDGSPVASIPAGESVTVDARITPSESAIAGDYQVTISANAADQATAEEAIRVTVETSPLWGIVGIGLIVVVVAGLLWVFRTYGRR